MSARSSSVILFKSSDGKVIELSKSVRELSKTLREMILFGKPEEENEIRDEDRKRKSKHSSGDRRKSSEKENKDEDDHIIKLEVGSKNNLKLVEDWCDYHQNDKKPTESDENNSEEEEEQIKQPWYDAGNYENYDPNIHGKRLEMSPWDVEFFEKLKQNHNMLFELVNTADYLNIPELLEMGCKTVADLIKGKTPEKIREIFNIKNDFDPGVEEQIKKENAWCLDLDEK